MTINPKRRKKKPPPRQKASKEVKVTTKIVIREPVAQSKPSSFDWLRRLAGLKYITSQASITLVMLAEDPELKGKVALQTLKNWSNEDDWPQKRSDYYKRLEEGIRTQIAKKQIQATVDQLQELDKVSGELLESFRSTDTKAGTKEGIAAVYLRMVTKREALRDRILHEITPEGLAGGIAQPGSQITPSLNPEEAREAALTILRRRQAEHRKRIKEADEWLDAGQPEPSGD